MITSNKQLNIKIHQDSIDYDLLAKQITYP